MGKASDQANMHSIRKLILFPLPCSHCLKFLTAGVTINRAQTEGLNTGSPSLGRRGSQDVYSEEPKRQEDGAHTQT